MLCHAAMNIYLIYYISITKSHHVWEQNFNQAEQNHYNKGYGSVNELVSHINDIYHN